MCYAQCVACAKLSAPFRVLARAVCDWPRLDWLGHAIRHAGNEPYSVNEAIESSGFVVFTALRIKDMP
jgi:hypothetical protein